MQSGPHRFEPEGFSNYAPPPARPASPSPGGGSRTHQLRQLIRQQQQQQRSRPQSPTGSGGNRRHSFSVPAHHSHHPGKQRSRPPSPAPVRMRRYSAAGAPAPVAMVPPPSPGMGSRRFSHASSQVNDQCRCLRETVTDLHNSFVQNFKNFLLFFHKQHFMEEPPPMFTCSKGGRSLQMLINLVSCEC